MSHLSEGFAITDIQALADVIEKTCPELELVRAKEFRTWTRAGELNGMSMVLPGFYQLKLLVMLNEKGVDIKSVFSQAGVRLPENAADIETQPWSESDQQKLCRIPQFNAAMEDFCRTVRNQDAEFVIRAKNDSRAYSIGLIPHCDPRRSGEYVAITDTYNNGNGLFSKAGFGGIARDGSKEVWGPALRQNYAVHAAERSIQQQIGNPESPLYNKSYKRVPTTDGSVRIEVYAD
jgi:hypothetical protein